MRRFVIGMGDAVLTELINGLDSCLRRNDKRFRTSTSVIPAEAGIQP